MARIALLALALLAVAAPVYAQWGTTQPSTGVQPYPTPTAPQYPVNTTPPPQNTFQPMQVAPPSAPYPSYAPLNPTAPGSPPSGYNAYPNLNPQR